MPSILNVVRKGVVDHIVWYVYKVNEYHRHHIDIIWYVYERIDKLAGFGTLGLSTVP